MYSPVAYAGEGNQYRLYGGKGVAVEDYAFRKKRGAGSWWWLRSPNAGGSDRFHRVYRDGDWDYWSADGGLGVSPGFCF